MSLYLQVKHTLLKWNVLNCLTSTSPPSGEALSWYMWHTDSLYSGSTCDWWPAFTWLSPPLWWSVVWWSVTLWPGVKSKERHLGSSSHLCLQVCSTRRGLSTSVIWKKQELLKETKIWLKERIGLIERKRECWLLITLFNKVYVSHEVSGNELN